MLLPIISHSQSAPWCFPARAEDCDKQCTLGDSTCQPTLYHSNIGFREQSICRWTSHLVRSYYNATPTISSWRRVAANSCAFHRTSLQLVVHSGKLETRRTLRRQAGIDHTPPCHDDSRHTEQHADCELLTSSEGIDEHRHRLVDSHLPYVVLSWVRRGEWSGCRGRKRGNSVER